MRNKIKRLFLPFKSYIRACNKRNKSCFLKIRSFLLVFLVVLFIEFLFLANFTGRISFEDFFAAIVPEKLVELTNIRRDEARVNTLVVNSTLVKAAQMKADDMASKGYFAHTSPEGITPWHWFDEAGYIYRYAGENLAVNFTDTYRVDQAWMDSPTHKRNIINERFEEIGIATAEGEYKGNKATFVVQLFGSRIGTQPLASRVEEETLVVDVEVVTEEEIEEVVFEEEQQEEEILEEELGEEVLEERDEDALLEEDPEEKESFVFMERIDDEVFFAVGSPEVVIRTLNHDQKYISFWGRISSFPLKSFSYFLFLIAALFIFSISLKLLVLKRTHLPVLVANELMIIFVVFSALLTNHYVLSFFI